METLVKLGLLEILVPQAKPELLEILDQQALLDLPVQRAHLDHQETFVSINVFNVELEVLTGQ